MADENSDLVLQIPVDTYTLGKISGETLGRILRLPKDKQRQVLIDGYVEVYQFGTLSKASEQEAVKVFQQKTKTNQAPQFTVEANGRANVDLKDLKTQQYDGACGVSKIVKD